MTEDLHHRTFTNRTLRGSRFVSCDFSDVVVRGSEIVNLELDSPWLLEGDNTLLVNGVDVLPFVDAELNRRFPGRELRGATDPEALRAAWDAVEQTWGATLARARVLPEGAVDASVDGEWSLAQTLRHLVLATDTWLGRAILGREHPYHPLGLPNEDGESVAFDGAVFATAEPTFDEVLAARADRQSMVRGFLAGVTTDDLAGIRPNPHSPDHDETVLSCLHTILEEEWEHHRYVVRDLGRISGRP